MKNKFLLICAVVLFLHFHSAEGHVVMPNAENPKTFKKAKPTKADLTKNVEFDFCKANISPAYSIQLNELAQFLTDNKYAISLRGHADAIGSYVGNWKMSEKRAAAIKDYLVQKGISKERIVTTAFGSTIPIADNRSNNGRKKNRRVEMRLKPIGAE